MSLREASLQLLSRKVQAETTRVARCAREGVPLPGFAMYDLMRGMARDVITLSHCGYDLSGEGWRSIADALSSMIDGERGPMLVDHIPFSDADPSLAPHLNLGCAHGLTGVAFALLVACEQLKLRGEDVICYKSRLLNYVDQLVAWSSDFGAPMFVTRTVENSSLLGPVPSRPSWCYGQISQAMLLLGVATMFGVERLVHDSTELFISASTRVSKCEDISLCHGVSGVLASLKLAKSITGDERLDHPVRNAEAHLLSYYEPRSRYGFKYGPQGSTDPADVPGLLNGAAGVAVALAQSSSTEDAAQSLDDLIHQRPWAIAG